MSLIIIFQFHQPFFPTRYSLCCNNMCLESIELKKIIKKSKLFIPKIQKLLIDWLIELKNLSNSSAMTTFSQCLHHDLTKQNCYILLLSPPSIRFCLHDLIPYQHYHTLSHATIIINYLFYFLWFSIACTKCLSTILPSSCCCKQTKILQIYII